MGRPRVAARPARPGRRGRLGTRLRVGLVLLAAAEVAVIVLVARLIGAGWTVLLLLGCAVVGGYLLRREGRRTWRALRTAAASGAMPARELADAILVLVGGLLLLVPGLLTSAAGLFVALPWTRPVTRRWLERAITTRAVAAGAARMQARRDGVVEGEVL